MIESLIWADDQSVGPADALRQSTALPYSTLPDGARCLALTKKRGAAGVVLAVSVDAYSEFPKRVIGDFEELATELLAQCDAREVEALVQEEIGRGNRGRLWVARPNLLRILVPERLAAMAKSRIQSLFFSVPRA